MSNNTRSSLPKPPGPWFYVILGLMWLWPMVLLPFVFVWFYPSVALRLLCKSTWWLFAGVAQNWCLLVAVMNRWKYVKVLLWVMGILVVPSVFLLPFGMMKPFYLNHMRDWFYLGNLFLSVVLHVGAFVLVSVVAVIAHPEEFPSYGSAGTYDPDPDDELDAVMGAAAGAMMAKSLMDSPLFKPISDDYYGRRREFDLNDESRRVSEDMQQFYSGRRGADKTDHYDWADVLDADTDGYFEE